VRVSGACSVTFSGFEWRMMKNNIVHPPFHRAFVLCFALWSANGRVTIKILQRDSVILNAPMQVLSYKFE